jgi:hypothetical protein
MVRFYFWPYLHLCRLLEFLDLLVNGSFLSYDDKSYLGDEDFSVEIIV